MMSFVNLRADTSDGAIAPLLAELLSQSNHRKAQGADAARSTRGFWILTMAVHDGWRVQDGALDCSCC